VSARTLVEVGADLDLSAQQQARDTRSSASVGVRWSRPLTRSRRASKKTHQTLGHLFEKSTKCVRIDRVGQGIGCDARRRHWGATFEPRSRRAMLISPICRRSWFSCVRTRQTRRQTPSLLGVGRAVHASTVTWIAETTAHTRDRHTGPRERRWWASRGGRVVCVERGGALTRMVGGDQAEATGLDLHGAP
jgi:hypothetical protein